MAINDFDFLVGRWTSRQRRLLHRLQGSQEWESFSGRSEVQQLPGGLINFDTLEAEGWRPGWVGMSLRVFNIATGLWSIHWLTHDGDGIDAAGRLSPPVVGRFEGDHGVFEGEDECDGRPVRVRFEWQRQGADRARWQQAFSADGGRSWEVNWVMEFEREPSPAPPVAKAAMPIDCEVVELRRYRLHPGQRERLVALFDTQLVEPQEEAGMVVMGQFRDLDAGDRFVWLRGFASMAVRRQALQAFYGGPVWQRHRQAANATMIDSDDVLLLRPAWPGAGVAMQGRRRPAGPVRMAPAGLLQACILPLREPAPPALLDFCRHTMAPCLQAGGAQVLGWYVTEPTPNDFPRLPVHQDEPLLVGLAMFPQAAAFDAFVQGGSWARQVQPGLAGWLAGTPQVHRLVATARSALHG